MPSEPLQRCCNAALIGGANLAGVDTESVRGHPPDRHILLGLQVFGDVLLPSVDLIARRLLRHDMLALELLARPPARAVVIGLDGFSEQVLPILNERFDVDLAAPDRPEPTTARFVAQVGVL